MIQVGILTHVRGSHGEHRRHVIEYNTQQCKTYSKEIGDPSKLTRHSICSRLWQQACRPAAISSKAAGNANVINCNIKPVPMKALKAVEDPK